MNQEPGNTYIGYEYKEISVPSKDASLFLDCYENFGWIPDEPPQRIIAEKSQQFT